MAKKENNVKDFILEFFKNSKVSDKDGVLVIHDAQKDFEDFIGEKAPYTLVFDYDLHNKVPLSELIVKGSYFLLSIRDYMRERAQTGLLKLDLKEKAKEKFKDIIEISEKEFKIISQFTFLANCQYLNNKREIMSRIFVKDNKIIDFDFEKFKTVKGNKNEIAEFDLSEEYEIAQKKFKDFVKKETKKIKNELKDKLEKELIRVNEHYQKQIKEKDEETERAAEKIKLFESKLKHTFYERDARILKMKIKEAKIQLEELKKRGYKERLEQEEKFHVNDETDKHALSIKNQLVNVTLIYYPVYDLKISKRDKVKDVKFDFFD